MISLGTNENPHINPNICKQIPKQLDYAFKESAICLLIAWNQSKENHSNAVFST